MNFFDGNGTSIRSGNEINTLKKQLKALQEQTDALSVAISDLEDTVSENKGESEQRDLALGENISINTSDINSLEENLENYKTSQAEITENQITRSSEYMESPLGRFVDLEVSGNITGGDFDDVKDDITNLQNALEETNGNVQTNADNIETLNNKQSVTEQKVDTILEQGEIPITTDEVQLGNALISENGNVYYGNIELAQSDTYKPVAGALIQPMNKTLMVLKSNSVGYLLGDCQVNDEGDTIQDFWDNYDLYFSEFASPRARMTYGDFALLNNDISSEGDAIKSINSGMIKEIIYFSESDLDSFTYNTQLSYFFIATKEHKLYKFENGILTDVTDTKTVFSQSEITISYGISCEYKNYAMTRHLSYEGTQFIHNSTTENGIEKWTYWKLGN